MVGLSQLLLAMPSLQLLKYALPTAFSPFSMPVVLVGLLDTFPVFLFAACTEVVSDSSPYPSELILLHMWTGVGLQCGTST